MCASFSINSSSGSYEVEVAPGSFQARLADFADAQIIADDFFQRVSRDFPAGTLFLPANETEKSLERAAPLIERLRAAGMNRRSHLVAVGGGVIQDLSAFVASIYMRGLSWTYVPTTVLGMVDSCIGGKSSINVGPYKNLVGTFYPPQHIYIDPLVAKTLPRDQFSGGLIEAAKICFCRGQESFTTYLSQEPSPEMPPATLREVILGSLEAKKHFIEIDEFDQGERLLLNFGHTFGHAIEGASDYGIAHGIAVGLGILCSLTFQRSRGVRFSSAPHVALLEAHLRMLCRTVPGLQERMQALDLRNVLDRFASDKKHTGAQYTLILISETGEVMLERLERTDAVTGSIRVAIQETIESYTP